MCWYQSSSGALGYWDRVRRRIWGVRGSTRELTFAQMYIQVSSSDISHSEGQPTTQSQMPKAKSPPAKKAQSFDKRFDTANKSSAEVLGASLSTRSCFCTHHHAEAQMKIWLSSVYKHFTMPPDIVKVDGQIKYIFKCHKYVVNLLSLTLVLTDSSCSRVHMGLTRSTDVQITRRQTDVSTSNLKSQHPRQSLSREHRDPHPQTSVGNE